MGNRFQLDEQNFNKVKELQQNGDTSKMICSSLQLRLPAVNIAFGYSNFTRYKEHFNRSLMVEETGEELEDESIEDILEKESEITLKKPSEDRISVSNFRPKSLNDYDDKTINNMIRTNLEYLKSILAIVHLKEQRKRELDTEISNAEKFLFNLISIEKSLKQYEQ